MRGAEALSNREHQAIAPNTATEAIRNVANDCFLLMIESSPSCHDVTSVSNR